MTRKRVLVTGGSGFLGQYLVSQLLDSDHHVTVLDLLEPEIKGTNFIQGDIRNFEICLQATRDVNVVYHNVAQVPLAKNLELFESVNIKGTRNILEASAITSVQSFVYTSSSAVFGLPNKMPANSVGEPTPIEAYGRTKLIGESLVEDFQSRIENTSIVRPRTILGSGRLGLFSILFDWISEGLDVFVFDDGEKPYQFIHAFDLTNGLVAAGSINGHKTFNLGATTYNTLRKDLEALCQHAGTGSRVRSVPSFLFRKPLLTASKIKVLPFASYQLLLYSQAMYFDSSLDWCQLGVTPTHTNSGALIESYEWFMSRKSALQSQSKQSAHRSVTKGFSLSLMKHFLKLL